MRFNHNLMNSDITNIMLPIFFVRWGVVFRFMEFLKIFFERNTVTRTPLYFILITTHHPPYFQLIPYHLILISSPPNYSSFPFPTSHLTSYIPLFPFPSITTYPLLFTYSFFTYFPSILSHFPPYPSNHFPRL